MRGCDRFLPVEFGEFRVTYLREGQLTFQHPQSTGAPTSFCNGLANVPGYQTNACFTGVSDSPVINSQIAANGTPQTGLNSAGIYTGLPSNRTGLPFVDVGGGFNIGNGWEGELPQVGNSFQFSDNLSWVKGSAHDEIRRRCAT